MDETTQATFEAVTRLQLEMLSSELAELKRRVNGLLWTVVVAVIVDLAKALIQ